MRSAIFLDGGYFLNQAKAAGVNVDYDRLADHLMAPIRQRVPMDLMRSYFYYCAPWMPQTPAEEDVRRMDQFNKFIQQIEDLSRWQVRLGKLEKRRDGMREYFEQKRVDVLLSIDMVRHAASGHIQHAILIAGDSDFIPAVQSAKEAGVTLTLWCGDQNTVHKDLITIADEVQYINWANFPKTAEPKKPSGRGSSSRGSSSSSQGRGSSAGAGNNASRAAITEQPTQVATTTSQSATIVSKAKDERRGGRQSSGRGGNRK